MPMRVYVQYEPNETGKGKFLARLIDAMVPLGVEFAYRPKGCDVTLALTKFGKKTDKHMPKVLRVDGVHLVDSPEARWRNEQVVKSIKQADIVVWQSQFCREIAGGALHVHPNHEVVIYNAAPEIPEKLQSECYERLHGPVEKVVALCAKWDYADGKPRRHKRLAEHAEFCNWYAGFNPNVEFRIFGRCSHRPFESERIRYYGHLPDTELQQHLCAADVMLYLPYYDWMPNSVVEAIACGLPVIASNNGGHAEIAHLVLATDEPLRPRMLDERVPSFEFPLVGKALDCATRRMQNPEYIHPPTMRGAAHCYDLAFQEAIRVAG